MNVVPTLQVRTGLWSETGARPDNQDFAAATIPSARPAERVVTACAAIADGVGGAKGGRVAAETAVRMFLDGLDGLPDTMGIVAASNRTLGAANAWLCAQGRADALLEGMACTFTSVVLRGRRAHVLHIGDSRLYRWRDDRLDLLTTDHAGTGGQRNMLTRALGLEEAARIDCGVDEARVHDRYLLCTDGVHGALAHRRLHEALGRRLGPEETARALVRDAIATGYGDNATALVLDVLDLPTPSRLDLETSLAALPVIKPPSEGTVRDDYRLDRLLADGRYTRVFAGHDQLSGRGVVLKFPKTGETAEGLLRDAFLRESWIAARVSSPFVAGSIEPPPGRRSALYLISPHYEGETLEARLRRRPQVSVTEGTAIAAALARGVASLHRAGIIHRDIKPDNVILLADGGLRLIDLGVARLPFLDEPAFAEPPGTPSYKAPELFEGAQGDAQSDLFALGVTVYRLFTGAFPYGEAEAFSRPRFRHYTPLLARRPDLPAWLDEAVRRACAVRREARFEDAVEFGFALEHAALSAAPGPPLRRPLYDRDPVRFWQSIAAILAAGLLVALRR